MTPYWYLNLLKFVASSPVLHLSCPRHCLLKFQWFLWVMLAFLCIGLLAQFDRLHNSFIVFFMLSHVYLPFWLYSEYLQRLCNYVCACALINFLCCQIYRQWNSYRNIFCLMKLSEHCFHTVCKTVLNIS